MKKQLFLMLACLMSALSGWAQDTKTILPWGADEPWQMKFVQQEPEADGNGTAWTQPGYDKCSGVSTSPTGRKYYSN